MNSPGRVFVVDDDESVLISTRALLDQFGFEVVCANSAEAFFSQVNLQDHGCVLTDMCMPKMSGMELQRRLQAANSPLAIVVVSGVADVRLAVQIMENGAVTLLEKPYKPNELVEAVQRALAVSKANWKRMEIEREVLGRLATLTDDERKVMAAMLRGKPNKTIAHELDIGARTVDRRRHAVLEKTGVHSSEELAVLLGSCPAGIAVISQVKRDESK